MEWMQWIEEVVNHPEEGDQEHWSVNEDLNLNDEDQLIELLQTGSVTTTVNGKRWVVELRVTEAR